MEFQTRARCTRLAPVTTLATTPVAPATSVSSSAALLDERVGQGADQAFHGRDGTVYGEMVGVSNTEFAGVRTQNRRTDMVDVKSKTDVNDDLLTRVLEAHGGLENWSKVRRLNAELSLGGPFWEWKGWPDVYANQTVRLDPRREHITFEPFTSPGRVSTLDVDVEREQVEIRDADGQLVDVRYNPRGSFPHYENDTPWDAVQVAYFTSAATWNYLTTPFVFALPGVQTKEIEPWTEGGQTWRRLAVTFPASIANHNPDQVFYYDENLHQRRMDYQPDVTGSPIAHYTHNPKEFDGFLFYTMRLVHLRDEDNVANQDFAPITLDITNVAFDRDD